MGKIMDMNHALANITGMSREKLTGTDFFNYFTEPQKAREVYQQVFANGFAEQRNGARPVGVGAHRVVPVGGCVSFREDQHALSSLFAAMREHERNPVGECGRRRHVTGRHYANTADGLSPGAEL